MHETTAESFPDGLLYELTARTNTAVFLWRDLSSSNSTRHRNCLACLLGTGSSFRFGSIPDSAAQHREKRKRMAPAAMMTFTQHIRDDDNGFTRDLSEPSDHFFPPHIKSDVLHRMRAAAQGSGIRGNFYTSEDDPFNQPLRVPFYSVRLSTGEVINGPTACN
ncbi:hypothetical protein PROFUN_11509 [Planoprotostelium fungivorum]|uniref:Uncharacterized protein n=1 Tax=Planoprotostelium fungivorum TaxID=1890364 RepID=A0A2P6NA07_9EUKA|nr:hypothetical protein PROFUN_11509 [Planoprotostelium fungivorum]